MLTRRRISSGTPDNTMRLGQVYVFNASIRELEQHSLDLLDFCQIRILDH